MEQVRIDFLVDANMRGLNSQISMMKGGIIEANAAVNMLDRSLSRLNLQDANRQFSQMLLNSNQFNHSMVTIQSHTEGFGKALEAGRLSSRKLWQEGLGYVKKQRTEIQALAREQVAFSRSQIMLQGRTAAGGVTAGVLTPAGIGKDAATMAQTAAKEWEIFNKVAQQSATQMVNWGKNTQWAGRQLMVGFTVPLMIAGGLAAKTFNDLDQELVRLQKVYGSGLTFGDQFVEQSQMIRTAAMGMVEDMAKTYGQAGTETAGLMADLAAAGLQGQDLMRMTEQTTRLSVLGEVDRQEAMKATLALQNAFNLSTQGVSDSIIFLNAVENQTSTSLQDLVEAIPRAGTVIEGLGGDVQDLALYMTAMREGGVSAAEGANALKSGLSSIIAPSKMAVDFLKEFGVDLPKLVVQHQGDLTGTIIAFQKELMGLNDLTRQQAITKLFGKYQFARMSAFFDNLGKKGSQTRKVMELMGYSMEDLTQIADQEIKSVTESASGTFKRQWQSFIVNVAEVGDVFLKVGTTALHVLNSIFDFINDHDWTKNLMTWGAMALAIVGPIIMTMGLFGNLIGMLGKSLIRSINMIRVATGKGLISKNFELLNENVVASQSAVDILTNKMFDQTKASAVLEEALIQLRAAYVDVSSGAKMASMAITGTASAADYVKSPETIRGLADRTITSQQIGGMDYAMAHFVPGGIAGAGGSKVDKQFVEQILRENDVARGTSIRGVIPTNSTPNFGPFTGMFQSAIANDRAKDFLPYFTGARMPGDMSSTATAQAPFAAHSPTRFIENMKTSMVGLGMSAGEVESWMAKWADEIMLVTHDEEAMRPTLRESQATLIRAIDDAAFKYRQFSGEALKDFITRGTKLTSSTRASLPIIEQMGLGGSSSQVDQQMHANLLGVADALDEEQLARGTLTQAIASEARAKDESVTSQMAYNDALKRAAQETGLTQRLTAGENEALAMAAQKLEGSADTFVLMENGQRKYLAAINTMTGELVSMSGTTARVSAAGVPAMSGAIPASVRMEAEQLAVQAAAARALEIQSITDRSLAEEAATKAESAHTLAVRADTEATELHAVEQTAATPGFMGKTVGKFANAGMLRNTVGGASMVLPMVGSMLAPAGSTVSRMSEMAMMGSMAGMMMGPEGMAVGAAGGAAIGGIMSIFDSMKKASDQRAAEAAAEWEGQFGKIDISSAISDQLNLGKVMVKMTPEVDLSGAEIGAPPDPYAFSNAVSTQFKDQIDQLKIMSSDAAVDWVSHFYATAVAEGGNPQKYGQVVTEMLQQSGNQDVVLNVQMEMAGINNEKEAEASLKAWAEQAQQEVIQQIDPNDAGGWGESVGKAYFNGLQTQFEAGTIQSKQYFSKLENKFGLMNKNLMQSFGTNGVSDQFANVLQTLGDAAQGLDTSSIESLISSFQKLNDTDRGEILNQLYADPVAQFSPETKMLESAMQSQGAFAYAVRQANPVIADQAALFVKNGDAANITTATILALTRANIEYHRQLREEAAKTAFMAAGMGMIDQPAGPTKQVNTDKMARQNTRAMDRLQEAEDDRLQAMQDAAAAREQAMQDEIDATQKQYDKEIQAIQRVEDKRQEAFQKEQDIAQRREEMRNMAISYDEAIANGELYEAARIKMDMDAKKRQHEAQSEEDRRQAKADKRVRKLERERDKKIRILNRELEAEQTANEAMIKSAQDASDAKIEAAQKAADAQVRAAEKANKQVQENTESLTEKLNKLWEIYRTGDLKKFQQYANDIGIKTNEQSKLIKDSLEGVFGKLPDQILKSISKSIRTGDWGNLQALMTAAIQGASTKSLRTILGMKNADTRPWASGVPLATGGQVHGPGTSTSDSIPIMGSKGEWMIKESSASKYGYSAMDSINKGTAMVVPGYAKGGILGPIMHGIVDPTMKILQNMIGNAATGPTASGVATVGPPGKYGDSQFTAEQLKNAATIITVGKSMGGNKRDLLAGLITAMQESRLINVPYGADDSLGLFQQRPSMGWGTPKQIMNPQYSSHQFFSHLMGIKNRGTMGLAEMAQAVQRSAYPALYAQWIDEARAIMSGVKYSGAGMSDPKRAAMVQFAQAQVGEPYVFGAAGPGSWDCSGLTMMAALAAGKTLPHAASQQWALTNHVGRGQAMAGDLAFFNPGVAGAPPGLPGHVGLMVGSTRFIQAANPSIPVGYSDLNTTGNDFVGIGRIPGLRKGASFVKYDNTIANLHKGESVLTAPMTQNLKDNVAGGGTSQYNVILDIDQISTTVELEKAVTKGIAAAEEKKKIRMGRTFRQ